MTSGDELALVLETLDEGIAIYDPQERVCMANQWLYARYPEAMAAFDTLLLLEDRIWESCRVAAAEAAEPDTRAFFAQYGLSVPAGMDYTA